MNLNCQFARQLPKNDNIVYIGDLVLKTEHEMLGHQVRPKSQKLRSAQGHEFRAGMDVTNWPPENVEELRDADEPF